MMGYLYYGNYAQLYEIGRVETMRSLGLSYKELESTYKIMMPVVHLEARYISPALYDDLLTVRTELRAIPGRLIIFYNDIFNERGDLIHKATVKLCFIDMTTQKMVSCPDYMLNTLKPLF